MKLTTLTASKQVQSNSHPDTFETLYNQYVDKVFQKCLGMTKDSDIAQDYTQDIFIKVFEKLDSFQHRSTFSTWLYAISHNYCLEQIRVGKRLTTDSLSTNGSTDIAELDQSVPTESRLEALERVLKQLPAKEVALLRLKYEEGLSITEIAQRFQLTVSAVKMRLKRTRERIHQLAEYQKI